MYVIVLKLIWHYYVNMSSILGQSITVNAFGQKLCIRKNRDCRSVKCLEKLYTIIFNYVVISNFVVRK